jgi:hypothetical protein
MTPWSLERPSRAEAMHGRLGPETRALPEVPPKHHSFPHAI